LPSAISNFIFPVFPEDLQLEKGITGDTAAFKPERNVSRQTPPDRRQDIGGKRHLPTVLCPMNEAIRKLL
jgi:hypothetical protein